MIRPTFLQLRRTLPPASAILVHLSIDGAAVGYFEDADTALFSVSTSAIHPAAWPTDPHTAANRDALYVTQRIEAIAALADSKSPDPFAAAAARFAAKGAR